MERALRAINPRGEAGLGRFSDHVVIQPVVATNGDATVNRAKVSTPSLEFRVLRHILE